MPNIELKKITPPGVAKVKNIIAVASGKGGVGKSTVATLVALNLAKAGHKVGLLDADIYGPSQTHLMGLPTSLPDNKAGEMARPIEHHGLSYVSMAAFAGGNNPSILRGPMVVKWLQFFLGGVNWGELDYLIIDMPPGTGDIQLTLAQQANLNGAIIVSTANTLAVDISSKGLKMFTQLNIPIIGMVENMSSLLCEHCGMENEIYRGGKAEECAKNLGIPFLGKLPMVPELTKSGQDYHSFLQSDKAPLLQSALDNVTKSIVYEYLNIEKFINTVEPKNVYVNDDDDLELKWTDGENRRHNPFELRSKCPCANCVDEVTGEKKLDIQSVPLNIKILGLKPIGRYGVSITFSDGHNTGIYKYTSLKEESVEETARV